MAVNIMTPSLNNEDTTWSWYASDYANEDGVNHKVKESWVLSITICKAALGR